jgi:hypothetical protein
MTGARPGGGRRKFILLAALGLVVVLVFAGAGLVLLSRSSGQGGDQPGSQAAMSDADYKAACTDIQVAQFTQQVDTLKGQLVKFSGQVLEYQQVGNSQPYTYYFVIEVTDPTNTNSTGLLPVLASFQGTTSVWIYDSVTVYGAVYGSYDHESDGTYGPTHETLPRVDARFVEKNG